MGVGSRAFLRGWKLTLFFWGGSIFALVRTTTATIYDNTARNERRQERIFKEREGNVVGIHKIGEATPSHAWILATPLSLHGIANCPTNAACCCRIKYTTPIIYNTPPQGFVFYFFFVLWSFYFFFLFILHTRVHYCNFRVSVPNRKRLLLGYEKSFLINNRKKSFVAGKKWNLKFLSARLPVRGLFYLKKEGNERKIFSARNKAAYWIF